MQEQMELQQVPCSLTQSLMKQSRSSCSTSIDGIVLSLSLSPSEKQEEGDG